MGRLSVSRSSVCSLSLSLLLLVTSHLSTAHGGTVSVPPLILPGTGLVATSADVANWTAVADDGDWLNPDCDLGHCYNFAVRLINCYGEHSTRSGRLEVWYKTGWGTVCADTFTHIEAAVVCHSLGYDRSRALHIYQTYGSPASSDMPIHVGGLNCTGGEPGMDWCYHPQWDSQVGHCDHSMDVSVACYDRNYTDGYPVRLGDELPGNPANGRLEIYFNGVWGTVCDDYFDDLDAAVACNSLFSIPNYPFTGVQVPYRNQGAGPIHLALLNCTGVEPNVGYCSHAAWGVSTCNHQQDAYVSCFQA